MKNKENDEIKCLVEEFHEQGHPEVIKFKYKNKWLRYVHFSREMEKEMIEYIKDSLIKNNKK